MARGPRRPRFSTLIYARKYKYFICGGDLPRAHFSTGFGTLLCGRTRPGGEKKGAKEKERDAALAHGCISVLDSLLAALWGGVRPILVLST